MLPSHRRSTMLRGVLLIYAVFVAVDCSLLGYGLRAVDNQTLPRTAVSSIKQANTKCVCHKQCVLDKNCTGVTTFETRNGSSECHFSYTTHENGSTLVYDNIRPLVSTLIKVVEQTFTTTSSSTPTTTPTTTTSQTSPPTSCAPVTTAAENQTCDRIDKRVPGLSGCFHFTFLAMFGEATFKDAKTKCYEWSFGDLASLSGPGELARMQTYLQCNANAKDAYWVYLARDVINRNEFKWGDGSTLNQTATWAGTDEPNNPETERCVRLEKYGDLFGLATEQCGDSNYIICRK